MDTLRRLLKPFATARRRNAAEAAEEWRVSAQVDDDALSAAFTEAYGTPPTGIWRAPGQANLMGTHTDAVGGLVLPVAVPWGVSVALQPTADGTVEARSIQRPGEAVRFTTAEVDAATTARAAITGWGRNVAAVFSAAREAGHLDASAGARIMLDSDLPVGAGLSSSAALHCATLLALAEAHDISDLSKDRRGMAGLARRAATEFIGAPTGAMAHNAPLRCKEGHALFLDCRTEGGRNVPLPLDEAGLRLLVIDTRVRPRPSDAAHIAATRRTECERGARQLGVETLRDVEDLASALDRLKQLALRKRVQHVVTEIHRVNAAVGLMRAKALPEIGAVLTASHFSLRDQFEVSCPELDLAVETAVHAGARGAKMTGNGLGGSAIALVAEEKVGGVREGVSAAFADKGFQAPEFRIALPSSGAGPTR
ncbi:galactokinase family protein [Nocardiopsis gilva]|uniref:galactokinase n=1 Tax=Nocardiopsis gilva TaxID=280236 RepID=UPI00034BD74E|nr:galactokinase family protein [Nocardiopsis gilva]